MIQLGGILGELIIALPYAASKAGTQELIKKAPELIKHATKYFVNKGIDRFIKDFTLSEGSGITVKKIEIKDITKVIKSLANKGILLKETTRKNTSQEGRFPLMTSGLSLMKNLLTILTKSVLSLLGLSARISAADVATQKKIYGSGTTALIISNEEMGDITEIVKSLEESGLLIKGASETIKNEAKGKRRISFNVVRNISC